MLDITHQDTLNLHRKVERYKEVLQNMQNYRAKWQNGLKTAIMYQLKKLAEKSGLQHSLEVRSEIINLEAIVFNMRHLYSFLLVSLICISADNLFAQKTWPVAAPSDARSGAYAFTNRNGLNQANHGHSKSTGK